MLARSHKLQPSPGLVPESEHCRVRARECRALAGRLRLDFARERMLNAADGFERNALQSREREINGGMSRLGELVRGLHRAG